MNPYHETAKQFDFSEEIMIARKWHPPPQIAHLHIHLLSHVVQIRTRVLSYIQHEGPILKLTELGLLDC
jgi:hypothetical protein